MRVFFTIACVLKSVLTLCNYFLQPQIQVLPYDTPKIVQNVTLNTLGENNLGFGFWVKWQPLAPIVRIESTQTCPDQFIYSLQNKKSDEAVFLFYMKYVNEDYYGNFYFGLKSNYFETQDLIRIDQYEFEGKWLLFYIYIDFIINKQTSFYLYYPISQETQQVVINDLPNLQQQIQHYLGGIKKEIIFQGQKYCFSQFKGRISSILSLGPNNIFENIEQFIDDCNLASCQSQSFQLVQPIVYQLTEEFIMIKTEIIDQYAYNIRGWVKLTYETNPNTEFVIFRITNSINENYANYNNAIYLKYIIQSTPQKCDLILNTNFCQYPTGNNKDERQQTLDIDNDEFFDDFRTWHYFEFQTSVDFGQGFLAIYFAEIFWGSNIIDWEIYETNYYTGTNLYVYLGGDRYGSSQFDGQFSNVIFTTLCSNPSNNYWHFPPCHYSCEYCIGPFPTSCQACYDNSNRDLVGSQCQCHNDYIDVEGDYRCRTINEVFLTNEIENAIICDKVGYNKCNDDEVECAFGYFQYENSCLLCPEFSEKDLDYKIRCSNCVLYPQQFNQSLICSQDLFSYENIFINAYIPTEREETDKRSYKIMKMSKDNYQIKSFQGRDQDWKCREGYYLQDDECFICLDNCKICLSMNKCEQCQNGYYLYESICKQCTNCLTCHLDETNQIICDICPVGTQKTSDGQCKQCGDFCASCREDGFCNYCYTTYYFISIDGINCNICHQSIIFCDYCLQFGVFQDQIISSYDVNRKNDFGEIFQYENKVYCAKCEYQYFLNVDKNQCEKFNKVNVDDSCYFTEGQESKCISQNYMFTDCKKFKYCKLCIINFCIKCEVGYYSDMLTGNCNKCQSSCYECVQQNKKFQDKWKWQIRPFYEYLMNKQNFDHPFEDFLMEDNRDSFEVICASCKPGFNLLNNICIQDCKGACADCLVIENRAICVTCGSVAEGFLRSQTKDAYCLECPSYCAACVERTEAEIFAINPYFQVNDNNKKYSRICYQPFYQKIQYLYKNQKFQTLIHCKQSKKCWIEIELTFKIYCSTDDLEQANLNSNDDFSFNKKNFYIEDFFLNGNFQLIEIPQLHMYLNKNAVEKVTYILKFVQGKALSCEIPQNVIIQSNLQKQVFTLQSLNLQFFGSTINTIIRTKQLQILDFSSINIRNLQFTQANFFLQTQYPTSISFVDCSITQSISNEAINFTLNSSNLYNLKIENFKIFNVIIHDQALFQLLFQNNQLYFPKISVKNLQISMSQFTNSSLLLLYGNQTDIQFQGNLFQIDIENSHFDQSKFLSVQGQQSKFLGNFYIINFNMKSSSMTSSILFYLPNLSILSLQKITLENIEITQNSYCLLSNQFQFFDGYFKKLKIYDSYILSNNISDILTQNQQYNINIQLQSIIFQQITYNSYQTLVQFIQMENYELILRIEKINISGLIYSIKNEIIVAYDQSIILIYCQICIFQELNIIRSVGLSEISIINSKIINISDLTFTQDQSFIVKNLHITYECIQQYINDNLVYFLHIEQYQNISFNNFKVIDGTIYNYPYISIKGSDVMIRQIEESIYIENSIFQNNQMVIFKINAISSLISIKTDQSCSLLIKNVTFIQNHLNQYAQDLTLHSACTLLIQLQIGSLQIKNSKFIQNLITNSTDSIIFLKAKKVEINNTSFKLNNILNYSFLMEKFMFEKNQATLKTSSLTDLFPINSLGGNGYFLSSQITLDFIIIDQAQGKKGGVFYFDTYDKTTILINNSQFQNTSASLSDQLNSQGGLLYINAQQSSLYFQLNNTSIDNSFSRMMGGGIFIDPSTIKNDINFSNLYFKDVYSIQNSLFSFGTTTSNNIPSSIKFQNITFIQTTEGQMSFFSKLDNLVDSEIQAYQNSNPLIYIKNGIIEFNNLIINLKNSVYFCLIEQASSISIKNLYIEKSVLFKSPLMYLNLKSDNSGEIILSKISIKDIKQKTSSSQNLLCSSTKLISEIDFSCKYPIIQQKQNIILIDDSKDIADNLQNCNYQYINNNAAYNYSLIQINKINHIHQLIFEEINFNNIDCNQCQYGLIAILDILNTKFTNILFNKIYIEQCQCGGASCLTSMNSENDNNFKKDLLTKGRILQQQNYNAILFQQKYQITLKNCLFKNNSATYGGALCIIGVDSLIQSSIFTNNTAQVGGAIYFITIQSKLLLLQCNIIQNQALIAGGIFLNNYSLQLAQSLDVIIRENNSTIEGNDISENPRSLTISTNNELELLNKLTVYNSTLKIVEKIIIQPYSVYGEIKKSVVLTLPSGIAIGQYQYFDIFSYQNIPYDLTFRIKALNQFNSIENKLDGTSCTLLPKVINITDQSEIMDKEFSLSFYQVQFDLTTGDFNLDNLIISFNPKYNSDTVLRIFISCDAIVIPIYDSIPPYLINKFITDYQLFVDVKTFQCQLGEFLNQTSGNCVVCNANQNQYQVKLDAENCQFKDESKVKTVTSSTLELREGYWRAYYYSTKIDDCIHLQQNCKGGWKPGDQSCSLGHIGALCEQCDLYDINGNGSFSRSSDYKCGSCNQTQGNIVSIFFVSLWTLISIMMSVNSTIIIIKQLNTTEHLKAFRIYFIVRNPSTAVLIKVFTNYIQIISTISTFQLKIPVGLTSFFNSAGNPIDQMAYSLDCFLVQISTISILYFRTIWSFLMAFSYIAIFLNFAGIAILSKFIKYNISIVTTVLIYVFIYFQPNLISQLISLLSSRKLSEVQWIQGNVAYRFETTEHLQWMLFFCLPILLLLAVIIPSLLFLGLRSNKNNLDKIKAREKWGYLYNEYKPHAYFWEFIKLLQKEFIIFALAYYEDYIAIKASLVFVFIFFYSYLTTTNSPYMTGDLNKLDIQSTSVCAISIILGSSIFAAQTADVLEIVWPFYTIIGVLNMYFFTKMVIKIVLAYFDKLYFLVDKVKIFAFSRFFSVIRNHPLILKSLETKAEKSQKIQNRFAKIRLYLLVEARKILKFKNNSKELKYQFTNTIRDTRKEEVQQTINTSIQNFVQDQDK